MDYQSKIIIGDEEKINKHLSDIFNNLLETNDFKSHPDFLLIETKEKLSIGISDVKPLIDFAFKKPYLSKSKIIYIPQAHRLTFEAQNSLLKILEEPPNSTQIIMSSDKQGGFLETILSRCNIINLGGNINTITNDLPNNLVEIMKLIGEIDQIKDSTQKRQSINQFLKKITIWINSSEKISGEKKIELLKSVNDVHQKLVANVNQKLALESIAIKIDW